jgi:hypothetical protein
MMWVRMRINYSYPHLDLLPLRRWRQYVPPTHPQDYTAPSKATTIDNNINVSKKTFLKAINNGGTYHLHLQGLCRSRQGYVTHTPS